jgi:hypothetical protein
MRQIIYLIYGVQPVATFTARESFDVDMWLALHREKLEKLGVTGIEFEGVDDDDFRLPWEV